MTYLAFNFCDLEWWHAALSWLLPFLLGLLAGWAIWAKYQKQVENLEHELTGLKKRISELEAELDTCRHSKTELESEIALLKGQLREKNYEVSTLESSLAAAKKDGSSAASSLAAGIAGSALISGKKKDKSEKKDKSKAAGAISKKKGDDLKKIEGVGPKIESLLNADGIKTYAELASSSVDRIQKILDEAGSRYRIANPSTWPEQAAFARDGKWDALEKFQDKLKGGKKA